MRIIFCGGRDYNDQIAVDLVISMLAHNVTVVHGGARGADQLVHKAAKRRNLRVEPHPAEWEIYGRSAGPRRNTEMVKAGASLVVAFPGGVGTEDLKNKARRKGIRVLETR